MTERFNSQTKKFILIFSIDEDDSTSDVIEWINKYNLQVIRINPKQLKIKNIELNKEGVSAKFIIKNKVYSTNDIHSFWYRRGGLKRIKLCKENPWTTKYLDEEYLSVISMFCHIIDKKHKINSVFNSNINKLKQLDLAVKIGLNIPETLITTSKKELVSFANKNQLIVTKSIHASLDIKNNNTIKSLYTESFEKLTIETLENTFFWTCFQKEIVKEYEVRSFYLNSKFYSMAIFSQNNSKTLIDFRNYDYENPNRNVPYLLPRAIEKKLHLLMTTLKLNSGSIDIIVDKNSRHIFLEVNPIGQFGMVSDPCNYYLEEKIALSLIENE